MNRLDKIMNHAPLFAEARGDIAVSFEFFPPKTEKMAETLWDSIQTLEPLQPRFVSVTYGAGGSTRERTHQTVERILKETSLTPAAHLTCVGASRGEVDEVAREYWDLGVRHIVALRGDPSEPGAKYQPHSEGYRDATELVEGLKKVAPFDVSVAAYPECHPDSKSRAFDIENLKKKVDAGADRAITQCFFSADCFFRFRDDAAAAGLDVEIVPGILPVSNVATTRRFAATCGASIPQWLDDLFEGLDDLPAARQLIAATVAAELCGQLYAGGVRHFHFYTLNRAELSYAICHLLGVRAQDKKAS
jgi:methylenetetrahydrofolate reductase (NADPH)